MAYIEFSDICQKLWREKETSRMWALSPTKENLKYLIILKYLKIV